MKRLMAKTTFVVIALLAVTLVWQREGSAPAQQGYLQAYRSGYGVQVYALPPVIHPSWYAYPFGHGIGIGNSLRTYPLGWGYGSSPFTIHLPPGVYGDNPFTIHLPPGVYSGPLGGYPLRGYSWGNGSYGWGACR